MSSKEMVHRQGRSKPGVLRIARTVFWSFFGVRRRQDNNSDQPVMTPKRVVVAGVIGASLFVASVLTVVNVIMWQAGH